MNIPNESKYLFATTGAKRWLARNRNPKGNAIFPLTYTDRAGFTDKSIFAYSDEPRMLRLSEKLATRLTDEFPTDVLPSGFAGPSAVPTNFYSALSVSGYASDPLPLPLMDNSKFVASLGLAKDIRKADIPYLRQLIKLFFGHVTPADLHIRKAGSTSFPYFTTDNQYKKMSTLKCLKNIDNYLTLMTGARNQLREALQKYHSLHLYAIHERQQPTSVTKTDSGDFKSKERVAPTEQESRDGLSGTSHVDFSVRDDTGQVIPNHFGMRRRPVWGFSGIPNYVMTAVMGCVREVYSHRFAFTYKTRGWEDKENRIANFKFVRGSDVKSMDTTIPRWFFDFLLSELTNYWDDKLVKMLERMLFASFVCPPPWKKTADDYNPLFGPDPLSGTANLSPGLPSGIFINPDLGKLWMTFVYVILYKDGGAIRNENDIEPFLRGLIKDYALLDMSDDATFLTNSASFADYLATAKSPYAVLETETPVIFLGDVFVESAGRKHAYPNPVTYIVNALARENSIDKMNPISYAEGYLARYQSYSRTPIFRDLNRIYEEEIRSHIGVNPHLIARSVAKMQRMDEIDAMVRANPQYLYYRIDPSEVSPEVLDEVVATIPASDFFNDIRHLFKVPTIPHEEVKEFQHEY